MTSFFQSLGQFLFGVNEPVNVARNVSHSEKKVVAQTAHHEAGHAIMGFYVGWSVQSLTIYYNQDNTVNYGSTIYNFGEDHKCAHFLKSSDNPLVDFGKMNDFERSSIVKYLHKRIFAVLGGPIAEHFHMNGNMPYENNLNKVDIDVLNGCYLFLRYVGQARVWNDDLKEVFELFQKDSIFNETVKKIASQLLVKEKLLQREIDRIIDDIGFTTYLEKQP